MLRQNTRASLATAVSRDLSLFIPRQIQRLLVGGGRFAHDALQRAVQALTHDEQWIQDLENDCEREMSLHAR